MSLEQGLRAALLADPGVALVIADRFYIDLIRQTAVYPCAIYGYVDSQPDATSYSLDGPGLTFAKVEISGLGDTPAAARSVVEAMAAAMAGWLRGGSLGGFEVRNVIVGAIKDQGFELDSGCFRFDLTVEVVHT